MAESKEWGNFAIGLSVGLIAGFFLGILIAPKSGQESRECIKETVDDVNRRVKEFTSDRKKVYGETWKQPKIKPYTEEL